MMTTRDTEEVAKSERDALLHFTGLPEADLVNVRLERGPFPHIDFAQWDGVILCGSAYDASAPEEEKSENQKAVEKGIADLADRALASGFPVLGICYGLGVIARHLGGKVGPEISEDISAPVLTVTPQGRLDPILEGVPDQFHAYVGHHESVIDAPKEMVPLVTGAVAPLQMARVGSNMYLTQFHPELDYEGIKLRIEIFADYGYYPPEERQAVEERVSGVDVSPAHLVISNFVKRFSGRREAA